MKKTRLNISKCFIYEANMKHFLEEICSVYQAREIRDKQRVNIFSIEKYYACVRVLKSVGSSEDIVVTDSGSVKNMKIYMNKDCKDHFLSIKNIAYDLALYPMSV